MTGSSTTPLPWGRVALLGLDIDGVLTDGGVTWSAEGVMSRRFDIKDGLGLVRFQEAGGAVVVISSSTSQVGIERLRALGITDIHTGVDDKAAVLSQVMGERGILPDRVAFMGDDLPDLGCFELVGLPLAPADAVAEVRRQAAYVTDAVGGRGAVREVCDVIVEWATA